MLNHRRNQVRDGMKKRGYQYRKAHSRAPLQIDLSAYGIDTHC